MRIFEFPVVPWPRVARFLPPRNRQVWSAPVQLRGRARWRTASGRS